MAMSVMCLKKQDIVLNWEYIRNYRGKWYLFTEGRNTLSYYFSYLPVWGISGVKKCTFIHTPLLCSPPMFCRKKLRKQNKAKQNTTLCIFSIFFPEWGGGERREGGGGHGRDITFSTAISCTPKRKIWLHTGEYIPL